MTRFRSCLQIEQAAVSQGLGWRAADYRITLAGALPSTLEIRCNLKGPYPKVRQLLTQLLSTVPTVTLRDIVFSRPNSDSVDVDAKLVIAVFVEEETSWGDAPLETQR
jgi:hypothetical protein